MAVVIIKVLFGMTMDSVRKIIKFYQLEIHLNINRNYDQKFLIRLIGLICYSHFP